MISVIIATRDRAPLLADTLRSLAEQEWPGCPYEILVVDNASRDATPSTVESAAERSTVPVVYIREQRPGKSHALNTALAHARGDLLVFTDDDVLPSPGWLAAYQRAFDETEADYAAGRILPLWEADPPEWMSPSLYGVLAIPDGGDARLPLALRVNEHIMPIGCNMAVRRRVVDRIGGWNTSLGKLQGTLRTGEDHEFALRMVRAGFKGVYVPDACVRHRVPADRLERAYFRRWFSDNGAIVAGLEQSYPSTNRYLLNVPRYLWRHALRTSRNTLTALVRADAAALTAGEMRLRWLASYVWARWRLHKRVHRGHPPPAIPTGA